MKKSIAALAVYCGLAGQAAYGMDLLEAYLAGLGADPLVLQAEAKRNAIQKNKPIGIAKLLPTVTFNGDISYNHTVTGQSYITTQANTDVSYRVGEFTLRLSQPVFHYDSWVQLWQADNQIAQAEAQLEAAYQDLAVRVATHYFDVLYGEEKIEVTALQLHNLDVQLEQVKERLAVGFSSIVDLSTIQAQHDQVAADLIVADQELNDAKEALREILGNVDINLARVPEQFPLHKPEPENIEAWRDMALKNNLNIIAALSGAEVAKQAIDLNFAGHLPTLDIQGTKAFYDSDRQPNALQNNTESIGLYVNVPVYSGGGVDARVEQARDYYQQSLQMVDQQRRATQRQVKDAFRGVVAAIGKAGALQSAYLSAGSALEAAEAGFRVGTQSVVDVLVVQSKYYGTRIDYARARYDYLLNGLLLKQAAGTLAKDDIDAVNSLIHSAPPPAGAAAPAARPGASSLPDAEDGPAEAPRRARPSAKPRKLEPWRAAPG